MQEATAIKTPAAGPHQARRRYQVRKKTERATWRPEPGPCVEHRIDRQYKKSWSRGATN